MGELSRVADEVTNVAPVAGLGRLSFSTSDKYNGYLVGATVPVGPGLIRVAYSHVSFKDDRGSQLPPLPAGSGDASASKFALSYVHNLSKRTALYATAARIRLKDGQNNPVVMGATTGGSAAYVTSGTTSGLAPGSATGYDFGIRHAF